MERKRFSVLFFIKRSKLLKNGEAPVRVRVTYDRLYVELQLKRSTKVPLWSQDKKKSIGKDRNSVEVNGELVRNFDLYLKTEKHCAQNTVIRYMKCFKKVMNLAIANEWITKNPFAGIKFHEVEVNKQFLSQTEINKIWQKEFKVHPTNA